MTNIADLIGRPVEPLHPELAAHSRNDPDIGICIQHPLVYSIMHNEALNGIVNAQLKAKRESLEKALADHNWHRAIFLHERPWRLHAFNEYEWDMPDDAYWSILGQIWTDSENIYQNFGTWEYRLNGEDRSDRHLIMDEDDRALLEMLPDVITVYRGYDAARGPSAAYGLSWTINKADARWFAKRFVPKTPRVAIGKVAKADVIAYFNTRNESEIVCHPRNVYDLEDEDA